ncbi:hypothetical protein N5079_01490 [Planotetraspora sp. A-T 1434]|uniref:hypothetical protein n=1 Tax=Planotetraspora sp. A-T 1434 TaxID=2979219 RepID=UPI0021C1D1AB|nr:hypothetical protein [Planotetraspora sp. A-T 1434]MCT9928886.1 hypothetical protein [Planotetraspora sp. A-T 1434]
MIGVVRSALTFALLASTAVACSGAAPSQPAKPRTTPTPAAAVSSAPAPSPSPTSTAASAVTLAEAGRALDTFLATDDVVRAAGADKWTLALTRDGQRPMTLARLRSSRGAALPRYTWGHRTLLVPRQSPGKAAQWFAATVERRSASGEVRTAVLAFLRPDEKSRWQVSFESLLYPGERPPAAAIDSEGYATALESRDQTVAVSPNLMGPLHATTAEEGAQGYASGLIAPGPQTTGYFADITAAKVKAQRDDGMEYQSIFAAAADNPVFALRTEDGGALVYYTLIRTSTWTPILMYAKCRPIVIPPQARWLLKVSKICNERRIQETQQYVGAVPPKTSTAPAHVIGYDGLITKATTR